METYCVTYKKNIANEVLEKLNKINQHLYQTVLCGEKNQDLLKIKK